MSLLKRNLIKQKIALKKLSPCHLGVIDLRYIHQDAVMSALSCLKSDT